MIYFVTDYKPSPTNLVKIAREIRPSMAFVFRNVVKTVKEYKVAKHIGHF